MSPWGWPELGTLFLHFVALSLMSVGGAITTVPEMHRILVHQEAWLSESQFSSSIALAQAAPGPNLLFVAVLGWTVGMNAAGGPAAGPWAWWLASACVFVAMLGILLPGVKLAGPDAADALGLAIMHANAARVLQSLQGVGAERSRASGMFRAGRTG